MEIITQCTFPTIKKDPENDFFFFFEHKDPENDYIV